MEKIWLVSGVCSARSVHGEDLACIWCMFSKVCAWRRFGLYLVFVQQGLCVEKIWLVSGVCSARSVHGEDLVAFAH